MGNALYDRQYVQKYKNAESQDTSVLLDSVFLYFLWSQKVSEINSESVDGVKWIFAIEAGDLLNLVKIFPDFLNTLIIQWILIFDRASFKMDDICAAFCN